MLLFESRARGDHKPSSDWDSAVITDDPTDRPSDLPLPDLAELHWPGMELAFISNEEIRRRRNLLGHLGCSLARGAKPIAGNWIPPAGLTKPKIDFRMHAQEIANALRRFSDALRLVAAGFRDPTAIESHGSADKFVYRSADAAEHLTKSLLVRNDHQPPAIRDLARLAEGVSAQASELAETIRSLNGHK